MIVDRRVFMRAEQGLRQLECDARARQFFRWIGTRGLFGIDDGIRVRQFISRRVVIGDDHIETDLFAERDFGERTDAAVNGNDDRHTLLFQLHERVLVQAVPFVNAMRDVGSRVRAERLQGLHEQCRRGDAIHIEIAVHRDRFVRAHRASQTIHSFVHPAQLKWIAEQRLRREKGGREFGRRDAAIVENLN